MSDVERSRAFYADTLGLTVTDAPAGPRVEAGDGTRLYFLPIDGFDRPADWPIASFLSDDVHATVAALRVRGLDLLIDVPFDLDEHGVSDQGAAKIAWFADPDGNVFTVFQVAAA